MEDVFAVYWIGCDYYQVRHKSIKSLLKFEGRDIAVRFARRRANELKCEMIVFTTSLQIAWRENYSSRKEIKIKPINLSL